MMELEVLSRPVSSTTGKPPLLFVHGAYVGAWCWDENFLDWFAARGYPAYAVSLRGHGGSPGRDRLTDFGLADYAADVAAAAAGLAQPPVLIGHSMGALVVQKHLERHPGTAAAMVLACPVPSYGLMPSSFSLAFTRPSLFAGLNEVANGGRAAPEVLAEALFYGTPDAECLDRCYQRMQRESRRALFDMSGWGLPMPWGAQRPPTLVIGAGRDALFSAGEAGTTARLLGAEYALLPDIGHAVMLDAGWEEAASAIADWLGRRGL
jgi:pimeloyl-ACP methyl ester carboxylesterase